MRPLGLPGLVLLLAACGKSVPAPEAIDHGRFENVQLYRPADTPRSVVMLFSGSEGWNTRMARQAETLRDGRALVIGIDTRTFTAALEADGADCVYPDGDLENLSRFVQAYAKVPGYRSPILAGDGTGAALAYATLAQAPTGTFAAGLVTGFCPQPALAKPLCGSPLPAGVLQARPQLAAPFVALQGAADQRCDKALGLFIAAMPKAHLQTLPMLGNAYEHPAALAALREALQRLAKSQPAAVPPAPSGLGDLPVVEEPATGSNPYLAIFWSGDGGWAGIDKEVASALNARGVAVVGVDSLRYFWSARTPEGIAEDIARISRHYQAAWHRKKIILIGYSQGANVLPFAVNRLDAGTRQSLALVAAMGLSDHAVFEFQLGNWVADNNNGPATLPEVARMQGVPLLCIHGRDEGDSICPQLQGNDTKVVMLPGGHHFDGDYERLATEIMAALPKS